MKRMSPYCHLYPFSVHYTRSSKRVKRETGRLLLTRLLLTSTAATSEFKFHREKWSHVTIMAMFTRQILGFAIGKHHQSQLVREAVEMALTTAYRHPPIFYADQGTECLAARITSWLKGVGTP